MKTLNEDLYKKILFALHDVHGLPVGMNLRPIIEKMIEATRLTWTTDKPTKEGYYWYREDGEKPEIVRCYSIDPIEGPMFWEMGCEQDFHGNSMVGEWYGPIEPPTE